MAFLLSTIILIFRLDGWCSSSLSIPGEESMAILRRQCEDAFARRDYTKSRKIGLILLEEAQTTGNLYYKGYGNYYVGASEVFAGNSTEGQKRLEIARKIAETTENDSLTGMCLNSLGIYEATANSNYYLAQTYFMRSLDYPGHPGSTYSNLAQLARLQKDTSGMKYARKNLEYGQSLKDEYYIYSGYISITEFHILKHEYNEALQMLAKAAELAERGKYGDRWRIEALRGVVLSHLNRTHESNRLLIGLHDTINRHSPLYLPELELVVGVNYAKEGDYHKSGIWLRKALESSFSNSNRDYLPEIYRRLAENSFNTGDYTEAKKNWELAYDAVEHSAATEISRMSREREMTIETLRNRQVYEIALKELAFHKKIVIFTSILLFLAIGIIIYVIYTLRKRNKLYRQIVQRNLELIEAEKKRKDKDNVKESRSLDTEHSSVSVKASKSKTLFESLEKLMATEELYRNPQLTREEIIEHLNTNSTYLSESIRENAGMNYAQYINSLRIKEAIRLISDTTRITTPIKSLATEAGFNSSTTFYKIFQESVGISPAAYRRSLIKINQGT